MGLPSAQTQAILPGSSTVARASVAGRRSEADGGGAGSVIGRPGPIHELARSRSRARQVRVRTSLAGHSRSLVGTGSGTGEKLEKNLRPRGEKRQTRGLLGAGARRSVMTGPTKVAKVAAKAASGGMASKFLRWVNSEAGPKTTHFWGPIANWGFVVAVSAPHTHTLQIHPKRSSSSTTTRSRSNPDGHALIFGIPPPFSRRISLHLRD